jgi:glutathione S-transferase
MGRKAMLRILGRLTSINVRKVVWTADELGLAYEREDWGQPLRDPRVPDFLALNPNGTVPVMVDDGFVLWESTAIMRYLCQKSGDGRLLPDDLRVRSVVEQWLSWHGTELMPAWRYAVYALVRHVPGYDDPQRIAASLEALTARLAIVAGQLERTGACIAGDAFTLADIALGLCVHRWSRLPGAKEELPAVRAYYERLRARQAGARYMSEAYD